MDFKERGVDLEVEGVRYIEMHRGPLTFYVWARLLQGAESMCPCENIAYCMERYLVWRLNVGVDKQEVQDICEHTALRARKWSGFICK